MIYPIYDKNIPHSQRHELNDKILLSINRNKKEFTNAEIYNYYTGLGGLHDLDINDYSSYHEYSEEKKSFELGQFFTPHRICESMIELISPDPSQTVLDMCCGIGNFFNHLPNQYNTYGFDIDPNAVNIAKRLYPDANIEVNDIRSYDPGMTFDFIVGNPPFNLDFDGIRSQYYYTHKAYWLLNPGGLMMLIMPVSYLSNESADRTYISMINRDFSFIGQTELSSEAFSSLGVTNFRTKIMVFNRKSDHIETIPYKVGDFVDIYELKKRIDDVKSARKNARLKLMREKNIFSENSLQSRFNKYKLLKEEAEISGKSPKLPKKLFDMEHTFSKMSTYENEQAFEFKLRKYLYELKTHKHLKNHYARTLALVAKYRDQKPPMQCTDEQYKHWEKYIKISPSQLLGKIRKIIRMQNIKPREETHLVRTQYGFKLKNYANPLSDRNTDKYVPLYDIIANNVPLPTIKKMTPTLEIQYALAEKIIAKKKREHNLENAQYKEMSENTELNDYIDGLTFIGMKQTECVFSDVQKKDMRLLFQKRYSLLNWQQGSGKTAVLYHFGKLQLDRERVQNVIIVAPSIAVHLTWEPFLKYNNEDYILISKQEDLNDIPSGKFIVISVSMLGKVEEAVRLFMKKRSQKICLLFDESDELTNSASLRTKRSLKCFRRAKYKMLGTGTTTRNYISELYSQLQLLYNCSVNFMCYCSDIYYENDKREIYSKTNNYFRRPFPYYHGAALFKACFNPGKATVFGIEKQNQDVYNKDHLLEIIGKSIVTRKFKDFAGDKYSIHTQTVKPAEGEFNVYEKVIKEFHSIFSSYFKSTGDARKDASLKIVRQIQLLIKACSVPDMMLGYCSDSLPQKVIHIENMVRNINEKVTVGCTSLEALDCYQSHFHTTFSDRPQFIIKGDVTFQRRRKILHEFEKTENGILICMQQSLKSSVNIPECKEIILESLQWNIPRMEQFYFRFIRFDSEGHTNVHFVNYSDSIEQNIMALILQKERLNDFIQTGEVTEESAIFDEFGVSPTIIDRLFRREQDDKGQFHIILTPQKFVA